MVDDLVAGAVEPRRQHALRDGQTDGVGEPLPQGPGGHLHPRGEAALGVAGAQGAPLAEPRQLLQREVVARQVKEGVEQHRGVSGGEDEPIAVGPARVGRIVLQVPRPQHVAQGGQGHGRAGVPGVGGLHAVDGQRADRVDGQLVRVARHVTVGFPTVRVDHHIGPQLLFVNRHAFLLRNPLPASIARGDRGSRRVEPGSCLGQDPRSDPQPGRGD